MPKFYRYILRLALIATIASLVWHGIAALGTRFGLWDLGFGLGTMSREWAPSVFYIAIGLGLLTLVLSLLLKPRSISGLIIGALAISLPYGVKLQTDKAWS